MSIAGATEAEFSPIVVKDLGSAYYLDVWRSMQAFTDGRSQSSDMPVTDELWLVEHPAVYTQGQAGKPEHVLVKTQVPIVQTDRGGQVTFHGPGQLVAYPLLDLKRKKLGVRELVTRIERSVIECLHSFDIEAAAKPDAPGVYVEGKKIASLGLRVRRGCSFHGVSLNIDMDLSPFLAINPCGYAQLEMTRVADWLGNKREHSLFQLVKKRYLNCLLQALECKQVD